MLEFVVTADGSKTIFNSEVGELYHSRHGALQESRHVFLRSGLEYRYMRGLSAAVSVLEVGFGTGLNYLLAADYCRSAGLQLDYTGIEANPLSGKMIAATGYEKFVSSGTWSGLIGQYRDCMEGRQATAPGCTLHIAACPLLKFQEARTFDLLFYDAFAAAHQPEMWDRKAIAHATTFLKEGGVFVTYAITGNLKRMLKELGFIVEKAPGAPGKREMLRAIRRPATW